MYFGCFDRATVHFHIKACDYCHDVVSQISDNFYMRAYRNSISSRHIQIPKREIGRFYIFIYLFKY